MEKFNFGLNDVKLNNGTRLKSQTYVHPGKTWMRIIVTSVGFGKAIERTTKLWPEGRL
jgi:hypothetical protein